MTTWFACEYPERPLDERVKFHLLPKCHGCAVSMDAAVRRSGSFIADIFGDDVIAGWLDMEDGIRYILAPAVMEHFSIGPYRQTGGAS